MWTVAVIVVVLAAIAGVIRLLSHSPSPEPFEGEGRMLSEILDELFHGKLVRLLMPSESGSGYCLVCVTRRDEIVLDAADAERRTIRRSELVDVLCRHVAYDAKNPLGERRAEAVVVFREALAKGQDHQIWMWLASVSEDVSRIEQFHLAFGEPLTTD